MAVAEIHRFAVDAGSTVWVGQCAGCGTWFLIEAGRTDATMRFMVDGPTCRECDPRGDDPDPDGLDPARRPDVRAELDQAGPSSGRRPAFDRKPRPPSQPRHSATDEPDRNTPKPCTSDTTAGGLGSVGTSLGTSPWSTPPNRKPADRHAESATPAGGAGATLADQAGITHRPAGMSSALTDERSHVNTVLNKIAEELKPGSGLRGTVAQAAETALGEPVTRADTSDWAVRCCEQLGQMATALDNLRNTMAAAAGNAVQVVIRLTGASRLVAMLAGEITRRAVAGSLRPMHDLARCLRLLGVAMCVAAERPVSTCECLPGLIRDVATLAAADAAQSITGGLRELAAEADRSLLALPGTHATTETVRLDEWAIAAVPSTRSLHDDRSVPTDATTSLNSRPQDSTPMRRPPSQVEAAVATDAAGLDRRDASGADPTGPTSTTTPQPEIDQSRTSPSRPRSPRPRIRALGRTLLDEDDTLGRSRAPEDGGPSLRVTRQDQNVFDNWEPERKEFGGPRHRADGQEQIGRELDCDGQDDGLAW